MYLILTFPFSLFIKFKTKTNKKFACLINKFVDFQNLMTIEFCWRLKNLGPIGSDVWSFIEYKRTDRQSKTAWSQEIMPPVSLKGFQVTQVFCTTCYLEVNI